MGQILAVKSSTYFLGEVPQLHSLVENMTSQQLAHFSRVLALLVFEPEYRQLMESAHVLRYTKHPWAGRLEWRDRGVDRGGYLCGKKRRLFAFCVVHGFPRLLSLCYFFYAAVACRLARTTPTAVRFVGLT